MDNRDYENIIKSLDDNTDVTFLEISKILVFITGNILFNDEHEQIKSLKLDSENINKLLIANGAMECLFKLGFTEDDDKLTLTNKCPTEIVFNFYKYLLKTRQQVLLHRQLMLEKDGLNLYNPLFFRIKKQFDDVLVYRDECVLELARRIVPFDALKKKATERYELGKNQQKTLKKGISSCGNNIYNINEVTFHDCLLYELLKWFKQDFFEWVDTPKCDKCLSANTQLKDNVIVDDLRVEKYICNNCSAIVSFVRYDNPGVLLYTRRGRCGEWCNAFTLICRAIGWDARHVCDGQDHVWTEVYSEEKQRWIHCDPCETAMDTPLMYEVGWKKQLNYVIACSPYEVQDVTWRYSKNHLETRIRRMQQQNEIDLALILDRMRMLRQSELTPDQQKGLEERTVKELVQLFEENKISDGDELERQSGSLMWRLQRGEATMKSFNHIWYPLPDNNDQILVRYCSVTDCYEQLQTKDGPGVCVLNGWQTGTYQTNGICRKEEFDWKMVYLARIETSDSKTEGRIVWKFASSHSNIVIDKIDLLFNSRTFENGIVSVELSDGEMCVDDHRLIELVETSPDSWFSTQKFNGKQQVYLTAVLKGGDGDNAWQHAQLFRQSTKQKQLSNRYPFIVYILFKKL